MKGRKGGSGIVLAVIGAGSSYTPMIVSEMASRRARLPIERIRLYDIEPRRRDIVAGFCGRLIGDPGLIGVPRSLREAVDGADFVLSQFRVGGTRMRHRDIMLGLRHGLIGQETTGVGGFAKALRTIPPTLEICRAMLKYAADGAWLVNFTNPSGLITEAALKHGGVRSVGLCNGPFNLRNSVARQLKADPRDVIVDYVGANHLGWVRGARLRGRDVTGRLRRAHARAVAKSACDPDRDPVFRRVMSLPYNGYLNYFYYTETMLRKLREAKLSRAEEVAAIERELFRKYADPAVSTIPEDLKKRGGHSYNLVAANLIEAITRDLGDVLIVNVQNGGAVENIERDATVEVTCRVGAGGARPMFRGALPAQFRGLLQVVKAYEELAVEAGAKGDLEAALHALIVHPLGPTACGAARLLRDLLRVNRGYLPQFGAPAAKRFFAA